MSGGIWLGSFSGIAVWALGRLGIEDWGTALSGCLWVLAGKALPLLDRIQVEGIGQ
jgi:hypothetical protein